MKLGKLGPLILMGLILKELVWSLNAPKIVILNGALVFVCLFLYLLEDNM